MRVYFYSMGTPFNPTRFSVVLPGKPAIGEKVNLGDGWVWFVVMVEHILVAGANYDVGNLAVQIERHPNIPPTHSQPQYGPSGLRTA